jgi:1-phosphofructokinase
VAEPLRWSLPVSDRPAIVCVTPNAALDRTLLVPGYHAGRVLRAEEVVTSAGGKGINVARAAAVLGADVMCAGLLAGHTGRLTAELASREGLDSVWTWIDGETRTTVIVVDSESGDATVINEPGPEVTAADWNRLRSNVARAARRAEGVCICGSMPPGCPDDGLTTLVEDVRSANRAVWVDTSGPALRLALECKPSGIKVNADEFGELLGRPIDDARQAMVAAREVQRSGVPHVVVTLGSDGAVMVDDRGAWWARPPELRIVSAVGSGDAFLAGLLISLLQDQPGVHALRRATAAGSASALRASARLEHVDIERMRPQVRIVVLED